MPEYREQRELPYTTRQVFDLIADVEKYYDFLPWVSSCKIKEKKDNIIIADMVASFKIYQEKFTSKVTLDKPKKGGEGSVVVELVEGPFTHLFNKWHVTPLKNGGCIIDFFIDFKFRSSFLETMVGFMFDSAVRKMVKAFEERAGEIYEKNKDSV